MKELTKRHILAVMLAGVLLDGFVVVAAYAIFSVNEAYIKLEQAKK